MLFQIKQQFNGGTMTELQPNGNMLVQNYGLAEWLAEIEQQINAGYKFDFESNDCYPQNMGYMFYAILVPKNSIVVAKNNLNMVSSDATPVKLEVQKRGKLARAQVE